MTAQEAIYCLKSYQPDAPDDMCIKCKYYASIEEQGYFTCKSAEARNMAIKALESSCSKKPNESDWISRQDAIDAVMKLAPSLTTPDGCGEFDVEIIKAQELFFDIGQVLNDLPSVPPLTETDLLELEHRFGEWVRFVVEDMLTGKGERWEMRLIDADALDEWLKDAEIDAKKNRKYVFASAINTIRGNLMNVPTIEPEPYKGDE